MKRLDAILETDVVRNAVPVAREGDDVGEARLRRGIDRLSNRLETGRLVLRVVEAFRYGVAVGESTDEAVLLDCSERVGTEKLDRSQAQGRCSSTQLLDGKVPEAPFAHRLVDAPIVDNSFDGRAARVGDKPIIQAMFGATLLACTLIFQVEAASDDLNAQCADARSGNTIDYTKCQYPDEGQPEFGPTDAETLLDSTAPQPDSLFGDVVPKKYFQWKQDLYTDHGLKLGFFYQSLYMSASDLSTNADHENAWGQWWGFDAKWTPLNKGEDYEGSLVLVAAERGFIGNNAVPAQYGAVDLGSSWAVGFGFTEWDFAVEELYWEQWMEKDRLMFRAGITAAPSLINPFRFKDDRTSFTATPFAFHESVPAPAQGPGLAVKWWPIEGSEFYITGVLNDANGNPADGWLGMDWSSFKKREYFYAVEFGKIWRRDNGEFNRLFLDVFYVDERSTRAPNLPNTAGGGFKLMGSIQQGRWVEFASYTFNTSEGGATSVTFGRHTVTAGVAYLEPLGIKGEIGTGLIWLKPHSFRVEGVELRNQTGFEVYWKILVTPNFWVTPGFQQIWNPTLNPATDSTFIPHLKFGLAY